MLKRLILILIAIVVCLSLLPEVAHAQEGNPTVYVLVFFSPSCPHCHTFITEDIPAFMDTYGDQLMFIGIDVTNPIGYELYTSAVAYFEIPEEQTGVPLLVCGEQYIFGRQPYQLDVLIREAIASGGAPIPPIPGLAEAMAQAEEEQAQAASSEPTATTTPAGGEPAAPAEAQGAETAPEEEAAAAPVEEPAQEATGGEATPAVGGGINNMALPNETLADRLARDPVGNGLSIVVLVGLAATLVIGIVPGVRGLAASAEAPRLGWLEAFPQWLAVLIGSVAGMGIAATLVLHDAGDALAMPLAVVALLGMASVAAITLLVWINREPDQPFGLPDGLILVVIVAGLAAAIYLARIEMGHAEAACGLIGDCNTVNQSDFAFIFGVLSVGVLGVIGYATILLAWIVGKVAEGTLADLARAALLGMALFGVGFSTYLTFLEPFVIGATCAWCLTSALAMIVIAWLTAAPGWRAFLRLLGRAIP
jgi:uncharacterized membrane protein